VKVNLEVIQEKLESELGMPVKVLDESYKHLTHQNFQNRKAYLKIIIPIKVSNRLQFHRKVMKIATEHCNQSIHAIEIHIQS
jgi:stress-induced morphogen